jgi:hypothetical protein
MYLYGKNYQTRKWPPHMFKLTGLQTKLSKQKAITNFCFSKRDGIMDYANGKEVVSVFTAQYFFVRSKRRSIFAVTGGNFSHECTPGTEAKRSSQNLPNISSYLYLSLILLHYIIWITNFNELDYK